MREFGPTFVQVVWQTILPLVSAFPSKPVWRRLSGMENGDASRVGLHENVAVLDYENEYANLILRHNLSYERRSTSKGLLPTVLESVLKRRIMFKNLQKSFPVNTREWLWCEQRIVALKNILVTLYGTTGSFWNRLANVDAFEEVNRLSREILIKSKDIVQGLGYELLYADTDSIFLKKCGATLEDFVSVRHLIERDRTSNNRRNLLQISCATSAGG
jgi:DNA polymerase elongation subunit (family B)